MKFWYQLFSDVSGQPSTNRLLAFFVVVVPLLTWSGNVLQSGVWKEPSVELIGMVMAGLGSKVIQRHVEQKSQDCKEEIK